MNRYASERLLALSVAALVITPAAHALVERYRDEAQFLARLDELGLLNGVIHEGFESAAWDITRTPALPHDVTAQGITWTTAARDVWGAGWWSNPHGLTTNGNWARSGNWGLFENHSGSPYPTTIRISGPTMYAVGGWFNTNPDYESVGFLFDDRNYANSPGYVLPNLGAMYPGDHQAVGHVFTGIIDPDGFTNVILTGDLAINEKGFLEGGVYYGVDDMIIIAPTCEGDADGSGTVDFDDLNLVLAGWNTGPSAGDVNGDGFTNFDDLNLVLA
ncbi:MAG: hypothetical protein KDA21_05865, partial [Phycisphaerales bacterium]|nr:hypothetical protein [Phycisphaerales bacterium]